MAKGYKIRRTHGNIYKRDRNKKRSPFAVAGVVLLIGVLVAVGWFVYPPVYDFITGKTSVRPAPSQSEPAPEPTPSADSAPEPPLAPEPEGLHAVYAPPALLRDTAALEALLKSASANGYNAVMFDAKDANGTVLYNSANQTALECAAVSPTAFDLGAVTQLMGRYEMQPVARLYTMRDHTASRVLRSMAVMYQSEPGTLWLDDYADQGGRSWLNPYSTAAQDYNIALAQECVDSGVTAIMAAGVQFPTARGGLDKAGYGDTGGKPKSQALAEFVARLEEALLPKKALVLVETPAIALLDPTPYNYLGEPAAFGSLVVNAMPSIWGTGNALIGPADPVQDPHGAFLGALRATQAATQARLIPYVQAFTDPAAAAAEKAYGAAEISAQLDALAELAIEDYIVYHPDGVYPF